MKKNYLKVAVSALLLPLALGASLAKAQDPDGKDVVLPPKPPGGKYLGPQDVVPPSTALPPFDPNGQCEPQGELCSGWQLPQSCGPACDRLKFEPSSMWNECVGCSGGGAGCYLAQGYDLTFGALRQLCSGELGCDDSAGSITVCVESGNACEVHVFESIWLSYGYYPNKPICAPVPAQVCINGVAQQQPPVAFSSFTRGGFACQPATVCLTFRTDCMCAAIHAYEQALELSPGQWSTWDSKWFFHVGFTTCQACQGCR